MIKDILQENENVTPNAQALEVLHNHFPQCFNNEGIFDIEKFQNLIKSDVDVTNEGYDLNFLGKNYAKLLATIETTTVIQPDLKHNNKPENANSQNLYISGDNLDGLKHLLKSYDGAVKCIYIDPPYNTGTDGFVYNDKFNYSAYELTNKLSISDEQAQKIIDLTSNDRASHSAWLTFMYPRLLLARDLLKPEGVIFISIDDNEQANLKLLCDTVFGGECFKGCIPRITKRGGKSSDAISLNHDYVFVYSKSISPAFYPLSHNDSGFKYKDEYFEERGFYKLNQTLDYDSLQYSRSLDYPIELEGEILYPGSSYEDYKERQDGNFDRADWAWRWSVDKFEFGNTNGFVVLKRSKNGLRIYTKTYQKATIEDSDDGYFIEYSNRTKGLSTLEFTENIYSNDNATKDIAKSIGKKVFDHTKPISLMSTILDLTVKENDYVLDFFSGSATMGESVFWYNAYNNQNIKFILVQLPEIIKSGTKAYNSGYRTIDDIGIDRIKKSAGLVKAETNAKIDYGFKHYTLVEPSNDTLDKLLEFNDDTLFTNNDTLSLFGKETVLETWMVKDGYGFGTKALEIKLADYIVYLCGKHIYFIESGFTENDMVALLDKYQQEPSFCPEHIVVFGYSFNFSQTEMLRKNLYILRDTHKNLKANFDIRY